MTFITGITRLAAMGARAASVAGRAGSAAVKTGAQEGLRKGTANIVAGALSGATRKKDTATPDEDQAYR